ncbi:PP2C family protein-serine/threonine phosphatase [Falsiroseomonas oryzae]|uniref:PP2C family protein-serine/threonine phosphatase n=1 Tax=Falsiroseomonas oryzae TaxID=2766473 RepID=UPI0022EABBB9|nr:SpoIIE family protein phosphatase [Roseomonas sp. MO-31]
MKRVALDPACRAVQPGDCAGLSVLGGLAPDLLARVLARSQLARFAPEAVIIARGAPNDTLHFLLDGAAEVHFDLADRSAPIAVAPGAMFGEMSVIDGLPASAWVVAVAPCRVLLVPAEVFWAEVVAVPGVARDVMRRLSRMLRNNTEALTAAMQARLRHEALVRELALAREIQLGVLRREDPWFPGQDRFAIAAHIRPARQVGGDLYDAMLLGPDQLLLAVGDAAGKGIGAALFMMRALTLLRDAAATWVSLEAAMRGLNDQLAAGNDADMFVTMFAGVLDLRSGAMDWVNYGHCPPVLRGPDGAAAPCPVGGSPGLGMFPGAKGASGRLALPPGGTLVLYSDGVTEAMDPERVEFGTERLVHATAAAPTGDPASLVRHVAEAVDRHAGTAEQADDITLLAVRWDGDAGGLAPRTPHQGHDAPGPASV